MEKKIFVLIFLTGSLGLEAASIDKSSRRYQLIIDHDGGADDAMAIFMAILYEKYFYGPDLIALTTTHGNVNESQAFVNSQRILDKAQRRDIPIYRGASKSLVKTVGSDFYFGVDGLGDHKDVSFDAIAAEDQIAAIALVELSKKYKDSLVIMAIGSMTNIALAKILDPEFEGRLKQLYVGAGHINSTLTPKPEFNAEMDVEAYHAVVKDSAPDKVTVVPFTQVMKYLNNTNEWRRDVLGAIPTPIMKAQNSYERISFPSSPSWSLLDPAVAAIVLENCVVDDFKYSDNSIILCGEDRGINTNNFYSKEPNVRISYKMNKKYYNQLLLDIFSAELQ